MAGTLNQAANLADCRRESLPAAEIDYANQCANLPSEKWQTD
jgi:hypothetical protein